MHSGLKNGLSRLLLIHYHRTLLNKDEKHVHNTYFVIRMHVSCVHVILSLFILVADIYSN